MKNPGDVSLFALRPIDAYIKINGKEYKLKKYSFKSKCYFVEKYGQEEYLKKLSDITSHEFMAIHVEIAYQQMEDKTDFPTLDSFQEAITLMSHEGDVLAGALICRGLAENSVLTMAEQDEIRLELEKKKQNLWKHFKMAVEYFTYLRKNMAGRKIKSTNLQNPK